MRIAYVLIASISLVGCASGPAPPGTASPTATAAVAPLAASAPTAAPAATGKAEAETVASRDFVAPAGYQRRERGATTVYCRSDTPVGTRFAKEYCYTQADLERMEASRSNIRQEVDRARRTCTGGGCGGG